MSWIATLNGGDVAAFVNGYLPVVLLLTIILILPFIFYMVALVSRVFSVVVSCSQT